MRRHYEVSLVIWSGILITQAAPAMANAIFVWRDPQANGTPIGDAVAAETLAQFAVASDIDTIFYDSYGDGSSDPASGDQDTNVRAEILSTLHAYGLRVEALVRDTAELGDLGVYQSSSTSQTRFDAVRLDFDGPWPSGNSEPTTASDIKLYASAVASLGSTPLNVSIEYHWDNQVRYNGVRKAAYRHIMDTVAGVDVTTYQESADELQALTLEEVCYGNSIGRPAALTIETSDVVRYQGMGEWNTFFEEGEAAMLEELGEVTFSGDCSGGVTPSLAGFAYHFYQQSMGSSVLKHW